MPRCFQLGGSQHRSVHGLGPPQVQDFALLVKLHEIPVGPFLGLVSMCIHRYMCTPTLSGERP